VERWWHQVQVNGQPGALLLDGTGKLIGVRALDIAAGQVQAVSAIVNPDKLRHIGPIGDLQGVLERKERVWTRRELVRMGVKSWSWKIEPVERETERLYIRQWRAARGAPLSGQGEGDQEIRDGQDPFALAIKPRLRVGSAAFRAWSVIATVVTEIHMLAVGAAVCPPLSEVRHRSIASSASRWFSGMRWPKRSRYFGPWQRMMSASSKTRD
jgi:hypothetical protein